MLEKITLTWAQSLDGKIGFRKQRFKLSGQASSKLTKQLRIEHDCIVIGAGTFTNDNPKLTVRDIESPTSPEESPIPIILDDGLVINYTENYYLMNKNERIKTPIIVCNQSNKADHTKSNILSWLKENDCQVIFTQQLRKSLQFWNELFAELSNRGFKSVMIEGGAKVIASLLEASKAEGKNWEKLNVIIILCPIFIGNDPESVAIFEEVPKEVHEVLTVTKFDDPQYKILDSDIGISTYL